MLNKPYIHYIDVKIMNNVRQVSHWTDTLIRQMVNPQILTIVLSRICSLDVDMNIANEGFSLL